MNKELILQDLQTISDFLNEAGFETKITDNSLKEPKIVAIFPINDEIEKILTLTYIDLPKENLEFSKILNISSIINIDISSIEKVDILILLNLLNSLTVFGTFYYNDNESPTIIMKTSIYMDIDSSPNESVLCESILNMIDDCQILKIFILRILSGEPIQNIFDELKNK